MMQQTLLRCLLAILCLTGSARLTAQDKLDSLLPVRGFCIAAPQPAELDSFLLFIRKELAPQKLNTLILRVDYN
nr:glycoside hydrolase [Chitinophagaceae bacterium]